MGIEILKDKRDEILRLAARYGVERMRIFGSLARGQATQDSDIDFLAAFRRGKTLLDLVGFKQDLEQLLGRKVDVVSEGEVSPYLHNRIFEVHVTNRRYPCLPLPDGICERPKGEESGSLQARQGLPEMIRTLVELLTLLIRQIRLKHLDNAVPSNNTR